MLQGKARSRRRRVVLPEPTEERVLRAARQVATDGFAQCLLLGDTGAIKQKARELGLSLDGLEIVDPATDPARPAYLDRLIELRKAKGISRADAEKLLADPLYYGVMMVQQGAADAEVAGAAHSTADVLRPALQILKTEKGVSKVSGAFVMMWMIPAKALSP